MGSSSRSSLSGLGSNPFPEVEEPGTDERSTGFILVDSRKREKEREVRRVPQCSRGATLYRPDLHRDEMLGLRNEDRVAARPRKRRRGGEQLPARLPFDPDQVETTESPIGVEEVREPIRIEERLEPFLGKARQKGCLRRVLHHEIEVGRRPRRAPCREREPAGEHPLRPADFEMRAEEVEEANSIHVDDSRSSPASHESWRGAGVSFSVMRWSIAPYFIVDDVVATANFYRDQLGFTYERFWGEPPCFTMVKRSGLVIMLSQLPDVKGAMRPNRLADPEGGAWDAYVWIDDADALHAEYAGKGVKIVRGLCDQPYGCRDFEVEDVNGYRLCFGQDIEG